jgi:hypothetical protein
MENAKSENAGCGSDYNLSLPVPDWTDGLPFSESGNTEIWLVDVLLSTHCWFRSAPACSLGVEDN